MTTLNIHFDGRALVPTQPVSVRIDPELKIDIRKMETVATLSDQISVAIANDSGDPDTPTDLAAQHDHYLHGMSKKS